MIVHNGGAENADTTTLLDVEEIVHGWTSGNVTSDPQIARAVRWGGPSATTGSGGSSTFWNTDAAGGITNLYALSFGQLAGNTRYGPRSDTGAGYVLRSALGPIPLAYDPVLTEGDLSALNYGKKVILETVVRSTQTITGCNIGFANNVDPLSVNAGGLGFCVRRLAGSNFLSRVDLRGNPALNGNANNVILNLPAPIDMGTRAVEIRWEVTIGRRWTAELFINGVLQMAISPGQFNYQNIIPANLTQAQLTGFPNFQIGRGIAGPYYSRLRVLRVPAG